MVELKSKVDDLIKNNINSIQELINKFTPILLIIKRERDIPYLAYILSLTVKHLNENYNDLSQDWKAWASIVIINKYINDLIISEEDIGETIDKFIEFWKSEYEIYCKDIISNSDFNRDSNFVHRFL